MVEPSPPRIFLAHAKEDSVVVSQLYDRLKQAGYNPWLDKKDLLGGQDWTVEIPRAIKTSALFIACFSHHAVNKVGYVQKEFRLALTKMAEQPQGSIYFIPLRLDNCELPELSYDEYGIRLRNYQWIDYFEAEGFNFLVRSIQQAGIEISQTLQTPPVPSQKPATQSSSTTINNFYGSVGSVDNKGTIGNEAGQVGGNQQQGDGVVNYVTPVQPATQRIPPPQPFQEDLTDNRLCGLYSSHPVLLEMVYIPRGSFLMGAPRDKEGRYDKEEPQNQVTVPAFFIGKYPVTQFQWQEVTMLPQVEVTLEYNCYKFKSKGNTRPVEGVSWFEAVEFCKRLSRHTGKEYRLPSESQWEYACRAGTTTHYSFGDTLTKEQANFGNYPDGETTPVGQYPANSFGLYDMHGNVWEWCEDVWHKDYKGAPTDGSAWVDSNFNRRVLRGGSWDDAPGSCRSAYRRCASRGFRSHNIGFRVCCVFPCAWRLY